MNALASIALSGINAAQLRLGASAHNIANAQTPGFRRQLVTQQAVPEGGVSAGLVRAPVEGEALAEDLVAQMSAGYQFVANLRVLQTQHKLLGTLLDERA
jgi:flagellar hook-associated protein FlgK